jgi:pimeloyl-ACP methyl ester carboxylesterase
MNKYSDVWYESVDGLKLYARDYAAAKNNTTTILCMHGLSRNSADFEDLASVLSDDFRVLSVDQRGRGMSQWDPDTSHYNLAVYVADMWSLLDCLGLESVLIIGTSMGGLMGIMMAAEKPNRVAGLVINDIGPVVAAEGLARIMSYVGKGKTITNWRDAVAQTQVLNQACFPDYSLSQWQTMTRRLYREDEQGRPIVAYDPAISAPISNNKAAAVPSDLWPLFKLAAAVPMLVLRGELSDVFTKDCFIKMQKKAANIQAVEVIGVGHAPALDEPQALEAIRSFLDVYLK